MVDRHTKSGRMAFAIALAVTVVGAGVLAGWVSDLALLRRVAPRLVTMNPATAIAFILAGLSLALLLQPRRDPPPRSPAPVLTAKLLALGVAFIGLARLAGWLGALDVGIGPQPFAGKLPDGAPVENWMAPNTALNLLLLGLALLLLDSKRRPVRLAVEFFVAVAAFASILAIAGYIYDIPSFYSLGNHTRMALHTALTFSALSGALLLAHTDFGLMAVFAGENVSGRTTRRLLPAAVLVPALLGWLTLQGERRGYFTGDFGEAVFTIGSILIVTFLICWHAQGLHRADDGRNRAEAAMRESDDRFANAFEHAPNGLALVAPDGRWLKVNGALCELVGYTEAELLARTFQDITYPADLDVDLANVRRLLAGTIRSYEMEKRYIHRRGHLVTIQLNVSLVRDDQGRPRYFIAQIHDITARKATENALRESNDKFQQLADNITDAFWIRSADMREIHYISPAYERIWGRAVASAYANPGQWVEFIVPEDRLRVAAAFAALSPAAPHLDLEYRIVRPTGEIRSVRVRGFQIRDAAGQPLRHIGIVTDITEQKRTDAALRDSEERYRSVIENARDAIFTIAADGTFSSLNPAVEAIAGIVQGDWIGQPFAAMIHPDDLGLAREMFHRSLQGGHVPVHELRGNPLLPRPAVMEMTLAALKDQAGKIIGVLGIGRDNTERKRLEAQLFQSKKMETVGRLAGGVAHEFNSILTAIIGQSELLLGDLPAGSPLARNVAAIRQAADRAATLTRRLLAYGRKQVLLPEILDLNSVLAGMAGALRHLTGRNVQVRLVPAADLQPVNADAAQVEEVVTIMALNAAEAMPRGGNLTLETANVMVDRERPGSYYELKAGAYALLTIKDTGMGMSAEVKARVFEPFFSTKDVGLGTGLGLSTCYGIVKQSGGHISVESEAGRGTTFKIYLPQVLPATLPVPLVDSPGLSTGTETILMVEDDSALRDMEVTLLRRLGYTVWPAANGREALHLGQEAAAGAVDLLFTDSIMPEMNGDELARQIHLLHPQARILFTSGYRGNVSLQAGGTGQGLAFLQKPFTPSALAQKVREVLDSPAILPAG